MYKILSKSLTLLSNVRLKLFYEFNSTCAKIAHKNINKFLEKEQKNKYNAIDNKEQGEKLWNILMF